MVDLNAWRLEYLGTTSIDFGTHDTGYPFTKQVVITDAVVQTNDMPHPLSDALVFGVDVTRGRTLQFAGAMLSEGILAAGESKWDQPLNRAGVLERAWKARELRRTPGAVATLSNLERGRCVYGRPRQFTPDHTLVRKGWSTYDCAFVTSDDKFYALEENMVTAGLVATEVGGFTFATTFPMSTFGVVSGEAPGMDVGGDEETWPVVIFNGPASNPSAVVKDSSDAILFTIALDAVLADGDTIIVDCRPWSRGVTFNGAPANGLLRGSTRLDACQLPPAEVCSFITYGVVPTDGASATIWWRDAFTSL